MFSSCFYFLSFLRHETDESLTVINEKLYFTATFSHMLFVCVSVQIGIRGIKTWIGIKTWFRLAAALKKGYISDRNESIFIDVETLVKQLDQGHLTEQSVNDMLVEMLILVHFP